MNTAAARPERQAPGYIASIWGCREFWLHLVQADLRRRFQGTYMGVLWALLYPLLFAALVATVFGLIFKHPWKEFAPYVLTGVLYWRNTGNSLLGGCNAFIRAGAYIKQRRLPLLVYTLKDELAQSAVTLIGGIPLLVFVLFFNDRAADAAWWASAVYLIPAIVLIFVVNWALASISAFWNVTIRDLGHFMPIAIQAAWYVSPIMIRPEVFAEAGMQIALDLNPIAHMLELLRAPLLDARAPDPVSWAVCLGLAAVLWAIVAVLVRTQERDLVFRL
jgi:lipopolysaccharide transport system permease protein